MFSRYDKTTIETNCKSLMIYHRLIIPYGQKTKNQFFSKISKYAAPKLYKHVWINCSDFCANFQINPTIKTSFISFSFFWPPTTANTQGFTLGWPYQTTRKRKINFYQIMANLPPQNLRNMFVSMVRTSVSIFRSIRPCKPIL